MEQNLRQVLAGVADSAPAMQLLLDARNDHIIAEGSLLIYTDPVSKARSHFNGLLPVLGRVFWPDDMRKTRAAILKRAKEAAQRAGASRGGADLRSSGPSTTGATKPRAAMGSGLARGARVHRQLEDAVYLDRESFVRKYGAIAPSTKQVLETLQANDWTPLKPEFCVYDTAWRVAARFDMVACKRDGTLVFLEVKTGSRNCFDASGTDMAGPLKGVLRDSDLNRAFVQLAVSLLILLKNHPYVTNFEAYVVRPLGAAGATSSCYRLSYDFLRQNGRAMYDAVTKIR